MLLSFNFPFLDIRPFLVSIETYRLSVCDNFEFYVADGENHEFIRSFGEIRQRENYNEIHATHESIYCTANKAVKLHPDNAITFGEVGNLKKFIPKCKFKRLFTDGINCRVDIGIENVFKTRYSDKDIEEIMLFLFNTQLYVPQKSNKKVASYYEIDMANLGKRLSALYLSATTIEPKVNYSKIVKNWIIHANPMILVEIVDSELACFNSKKYIEIPIPELEEWEIRLFYFNNSNIFNGHSMPCWILVETDTSPQDRVRNLRVYLQKLHQKRECFKQVLKQFLKEVRAETFMDNNLLKHYIETYIYKCLLKKKSYGISHDIVLDIVDKADLAINHQQMKSLLEYFDNEKLRSIEERREKAMEKSPVINANNANIQIGEKNEQKFDVDGDFYFGGNKQGSEFGNQVNEVILKINAVDELQPVQKEFLAKLLNEAKIAVEENSENKKEVCKEKFLAFRTGAGSVANKVLSVMANFASIASFFGLGL